MAKIFLPSRGSKLIEEVSADLGHGQWTTRDKVADIKRVGDDLLFYDDAGQVTYTIDGTPIVPPVEPDPVPGGDVDPDTIGGFAQYPEYAVSGQTQVTGGRDGARRVVTTNEMDANNPGSILSMVNESNIYVTIDPGMTDDFYSPNATTLWTGHNVTVDFQGADVAYYGRPWKGTGNNFIWRGIRCMWDGIQGHGAQTDDALDLMVIRNDQYLPIQKFAILDCSTNGPTRDGNLDVIYARGGTMIFTVARMHITDGWKSILVGTDDSGAEQNGSYYGTFIAPHFENCMDRCGPLCGGRHLTTCRVEIINPVTQFYGQSDGSGSGIQVRHTADNTVLVTDAMAVRRTPANPYPDGVIIHGEDLRKHNARTSNYNGQLGASDPYGPVRNMEANRVNGPHNRITDGSGGGLKLHTLHGGATHWTPNGAQFDEENPQLVDISDYDYPKTSLAPNATSMATVIANAGKK